MVESLAYSVNSLPSKMLFMSATRKLKRVDPSIESCGTPKFIYQFVQNVVCLKSSKKIV